MNTLHGDSRSRAVRTTGKRRDIGAGHNVQPGKTTRYTRRCKRGCQRANGATTGKASPPPNRQLSEKVSCYHENRPIARGRLMVWRQREYPGRLPNQGSRAPWSAPGACYGRLHGGNTPRNGGNLLVDRATTRQFETSCATKMATNSTADIITEPCMRLRILENLIMIANTTTFEFTTSSGKTTLRDPRALELKINL